MGDMLLFSVVVLVLLLSFAGGLYCLHGKIIPESERPGALSLDRRASDEEWELRTPSEMFSCGQRTALAGPS